MMKNIIIVMLMFSVGILGFLLYSNTNSSDEDNQVANPITTEEQNRDATISSGNTIDLSSRGLTEVPKDILNDSSVIRLDVSNNNLTGALPAEIRQLTNLQELIASNNRLTGIPAEIGQLSKLKTVNFSNNDISGLPLELGNLSGLEALDLRGNPNVSEYDLSLIQPKIPNTTILTD